MNGSYANDRRVGELMGEATVTLHPEDAAARGLTEGQQVRLSNETGSLELALALPGPSRKACTQPQGPLAAPGRHARQRQCPQPRHQVGHGREHLRPQRRGRDCRRLKPWRNATELFRCCRRKDRGEARNRQARNNRNTLLHHERAALARTPPTCRARPLDHLELPALGPRRDRKRAPPAKPKGTRPQNLAMLRRLAFSIARREPTKDAMRGKLKRAAWNDDFLLTGC